MLIKIEMAVKSDIEELNMVSQRNRSTGNLDEVRLQSDWSSGLMPKQIASVLVKFRTRTW